MAKTILSTFIFSAGIGSYVVVTWLSNMLPFFSKNFTATFLQLLLLQLGLWLIYKVVLWPKLLSPLRDLPSPTGGSFFLGHWRQITKKPKGEVKLDWITSIPNTGLIRYLGLMNSEHVIVTSPDALREVLNTKNYEFIKPAGVRERLSRLLGVGVLLAEGNEHKQQRKMLMPAFAFRHIKDLYPLFWDKSTEVVGAMRGEIKSSSATSENPLAKTGSAVIEVGHWASRATLDIIGLAGMGQEFGAIKDPNALLCKTYRKVFHPSRSAKFHFMLDMILPSQLVSVLPIRHNGDIKEAVKVIRKTCLELIEQKRQRLLKTDLGDVDILSVAMQSGGFSDGNLVDQMMTFLAAGHETTSASLTWAIYLLCLHPECQTKLRQEVRERLPDTTYEVDKPVASSDIDTLPYLNAVCNEVLRYYPAVPQTLREASVDTSILNHPIPKGTKIVLVPWAINKDEKYWGEDARHFRPERWLANASGKAEGGALSNYNMLTFLHGPRSCIGQAFAKAELACLLAAWISSFEFELNDKNDMKGLDIRKGATARPQNGLFVKIRVVDE